MVVGYITLLFVLVVMEDLVPSMGVALVTKMEVIYGELRVGGLILME